MGLISTIYSIIAMRINRLEEWRSKVPRADEILTRSEHFKICKENTEGVISQIKNQNEELKKWFDLKIENVILKEIRKINGSE